MAEIAPLTQADHDDWLALWWGYLEFYEATLPATQTILTFERLLDPASGIHGAVARDDSGRTIGFAHWLTHAATWSEGPYCYLEDLFVHPDARGSGAGAALIEHVRAWAAEHGCSKVYWLTQKHNDRARALYDRVAESTGFVHYEIRL
ncbi:MAG TPA: GNAT family N-acetyltransferase [Microbacterium sp.]|uniref:GNAT family N-acetyltransferase n=1 Tax=Microbacterium sp. TaxID=51671 RepID=UPI002BD0EF7D|nr:GNAT family N-acetyltransferase [Microbacterium sp.]HWI30962.1 GNAT family N-acetyltransferase [Microbacterium sp.]